MIKKEIATLIEKSTKQLQKEKKLPEFEISEILVERPAKIAHGDYSTNVAMTIGKETKKNPLEIAQNLKSKILNPAPETSFRCGTSPAPSFALVLGLKSGLFDKVEIAPPGFINFFLSKEYLQKQIGEILKEGEKFGQLKIGKNQKINVEFISANPTGPLTLGNGRGGFCGDVLSNVLERAGFKVEREYYINDRGEQIRKLGHSLIGDSQAVYRGKYIEDLRKRVKGVNPDKIGKIAAKIILKEMIKPAVEKMKINFDVWFSEESLYKKREVERTLSYLKKKNLAYGKKGALWFKSTKFGDDKDRVLIKADGEETYFLSDIAYLKNKFARGFKHLIFFWGADHYGYIKRMEAAVKALGYEKKQADFIIMQLVRLFEKGKQIRMSKRTGIYLTIEELIDKVGLDVVRFFFLERGPGSHLNFDLDLAKQRSEKNPVYYAQYAYARIYSILRKVSGFRFQVSGLKLLNHPKELELIKQLIRLPEIIEDTARDYQVQRLPNYALELVTAFHKFYEECRVLSDDKKLTQARLGLVEATKIILKNTLDLMGISAPERM